MSWTTENKEVSSADNLNSLLRPFGNSLTYMRNKRDPRMEPYGTPARISTQEDYWPFKTTLCFQHARLYQSLSRHQGITLELQDLYRKRLKFHD